MRDENNENRHEEVSAGAKGADNPDGREPERRVPPRIYMASLSDYNAGRLHGAWVDADQDAEELDLAVARMLAASPEPGAEEWAIHDHEGFGPVDLSECESMETVALLARGIADHGLASERGQRSSARTHRRWSSLMRATEASGTRSPTTPSPCSMTWGPPKLWPWCLSGCSRTSSWTSEALPAIWCSAGTSEPLKAGVACGYSTDIYEYGFLRVVHSTTVAAIATNEAVRHNEGNEGKALL